MAFTSAFFFFNSASQGWSERYWYDNEETNPIIIRAAAAELLVARCNCLAVDIRAVNAYVSFDDTFRDVYAVPLPNVPAPGSAYNNAITAKPHQPNDVLVLRMSAAGGRFGKITYLSGVPRTDLLYPPLRPPTQEPANFYDAVASFTNVLIANAWGWKGISYSGAVSPISNVTGMSAGSSGGGWVIDVESAVGFKKGQKVKLSGAKFNGTNANKPRPNRVYTVTGVISNAVSVSSNCDFDGVTYNGEGTLQVQNYDWFKIQAVVLDKYGTRKRGVGYGRPLGRRRRGLCQ
jgi:hypothetical protein